MYQQILCSLFSKMQLCCNFLQNKPQTEISSTEIKAFSTFFSGTNGNAIFSWIL